ncbi:MAG: diguanylate cyclase [Spirochaetes bacterium]|nr:diguanylate cyclase [Spirochaetota bacterium]
MLLKKRIILGDTNTDEVKVRGEFLELKSSTIISGQYKIKAKLGEGGMASVYRAFDNKAKKEVAIKFLKKNRISSFLEDKIRFKKEVEIVSKFNHPGIVKIFGLGEYDNIPYIVMELLKGDSLYDLLLKGKRFTIKESVRIIKQITEALDYVHSRNILHRDLKPGNVIIDQAKKIKILDFGLAHVMELRQIKEMAEIIGTFGYMSPEATGIINKPVDERSDLYSLGIIFYRLLTGEMPFVGKEISQILHKQVAAIPVRPGKVNVNIPKALEDMIMKLLDKEPEIRYQSAIGFLHDIARFEKGEKTFVIGEMDQKKKLTYRSRLVGRAKEFNDLKELYDKAKAHSGSLCFIAGEAGIGKSRLVEELRGYVYEQGGMFFMGRCFNQENKMPFHPFKDITDDYIRRIKREGQELKKQEGKRLKKIFGDLTGIILKFNSNMSEILGQVSEITPLDDPEKENKRYLMEYVKFLTSLSGRKQNVVLFIDDIQWADEGSLSLIEELLRKSRTNNLFLLATYRDDEIGRDHSIHRIKKESKAMHYPLEEIKLSHFNFGRMRRLAAEVLGERESKADKIARYLIDKTKGNPFFAITILRELVERKALIWEEGSWKENWSKINKLPVSSNIVDMLLLRIKDLPEKEAKLLSISSVIGREFQIDMIQDLMKESRDILVHLIDSTIEKQLLEKSSRKGALMFVHDRVRDAFYARMTKKERVKYHLMIGTALEERNKQNIEEVIFDLAHHFIEGGDKHRSLQYGIRAADRAKENYANEEAIRYYNIVLNILEKEKTKDKRWMQAKEGLIEVYLSAGKSNEVINLCKEILPLKRNPFEKAKLYIHMGQAHLNMGSWVESEEVIARGLSLLGEKVPRRKSEVMMALVREAAVHFFHSFLNRYYLKKQVKHKDPQDITIIVTHHSLDWMYILTDISKFIHSVLRGLHIAQSRLGRSKELAASIGAYASLLMSIPMFKGAEKYHFKALEIRRELGDERELAQSLQFIGYYYQFKGEYAKSRDYLGQAAEKYRLVEDIWNLGMTLQGIGIDYLYSGDFREAVGHLLEYLKISEEIKDDFGITSCLGYLIEVYLEQGEIDTAEKALRRGYSIVQAKKLPFPLLGMHIGMSILSYEKGNYADAIKYAQLAREINETHDFLKNYTANLYFVLADAHIENYKKKKKKDRGHLKLIRSLCRDALKKAAPWVTHYMSALRSYAKYHILINKRKKAEILFFKSMELARKLGRKFELGKTLFEMGYFYEAGNKIESAHHYWQQAFKVFQEIGSREYIKRCASVLGLDLKVQVAKESPKERLQIEREMTTVLETSRYFSSILDLEELLEKIIEKAIQLVGAERGILLLYPVEEKKDKILEVKVAKNVKDVELEGELFHTSSGIINRVEQGKKPLIVDDATLDKDFKDEASIVRFGIKSALSLPIMGREEMLGVIYLDNRLVSGVFTEEDLRVLEVISRQAGISIENAILYKKAITDGLTELYTHNFFENFLSKSVELATRYKNKLSLLMLDIDHFKNFNDKYGHRAGDLVLKKIALIIKKNIRKSDSAARYGGEEFAVIIPETGLDGAKILAEKLRKIIESNRVSYRMGKKDIQLRITASIGVAELEPGEEWQELVVRSDKALYKAKEKGRNCVQT